MENDFPHSITFVLLSCWLSCLPLYLLPFCIFMENEKIVYNLTTDECNLDDIQISADAVSDTIYLLVSFLLLKIHLNSNAFKRLFKLHPNMFLFFFFLHLTRYVMMEFYGIISLFSFSQEKQKIIFP